MKIKGRNKGYTLVEALVSIAMIVVLIAIISIAFLSPDDDTYKNKGRAAYLNGVPAEANPYLGGSSQYNIEQSELWLEGWQEEAREDKNDDL